MKAPTGGPRVIEDDHPDDSGEQGEEVIHPCPYLQEMFLYMGMKDSSYRMKCLLCLPKSTENLAFKNSPSNLKKHIENVLVLTCVLLLVTLCPDVLSRRGFGGIGGRWGGIGKAGGGAIRGGGVHRVGSVGREHHYKVPHANGGSSSSGSSTGKMAGAAAAGAAGGMMIGHGLGSMSRPRYGYGHGGYGGYGGYGYGVGHVRYDNGTGFRNETDMEYYTGAASRGHTYSCVLLFGATVSLLIGF